MTNFEMYILGHKTVSTSLIVIDNCGILLYNGDNGLFT